MSGENIEAAPLAAVPSFKIQHTLSTALPSESLPADWEVNGWHQS
jgi:hypothetical protein